jgi:hypothetical protein
MPFTPAGNVGFNIPTTVASEQPTSLNFLNSLALEGLVSTLSPVMPEVGRDLTPRYGTQSILGMFKYQFGATTRVVGNSYYSHFEEDFIEGAIAVDTTSGGAPGASVVYSVRAADEFEIPQGAPYIGSNTIDVATPFVGAVLIYPNGVEGLVTDVTLPDFTVFPLDENEALPSVTNTDFIMIKATAVEEGSAPLDSRNSRLILYQNIIQKHRSDYKITDVAGGELLWFKVPAGDGYGLQNRWTFKGIRDTKIRHWNGLERILLDGKPITNPLLAAVAPTTTTSEGLIETIQNAGNVSTYVQNAMTLEDIDDLIESFIRFKAPQDFYVPCGYDWYKDMNALFREGDGVDLWTQSTTGASPGRLEFADFSGEKRTLNLDINGFTRLGHTFAVTPLSTFSDPTTYGNVEKYKKLAIFVPIGQTVAFAPEDPSTKVTVPTLGLVTKTDIGGQGNLEYKDWVYGGLGNGSDGDAVMKYAALSHVGLEVFAINRFGLMTATAS